MAWFVGKLSYVHGKHCQDKFLQQAPNSRIAQQILKLREDNNKEVVSHRSIENSREDFGYGVVTEEEKSILNECNSTAFWNYSLPLMVLFPSLVFVALKKGLLAPSKVLKKYPNFPKMNLAAATGYVVGQWLYMKSEDCSEKFERFAPDSKMARLFRNGGYVMGNDQFHVEYLPESQSNGLGHQKETPKNDIPNSYEGYVMPSTRLQDIEKNMFDSSNSFDVLINKEK